MADNASDESRALKRKSQNLGTETHNKEITHASKEMHKAQSRAVSMLKPGGKDVKPEVKNMKLEVKDLRPGGKDAKPGGRDLAMLKISESERNKGKEVAEPHSFKRLRRIEKQ